MTSDPPAVPRMSSPTVIHPNQFRALTALTYYPFIAMLRNISTTVFGFAFPVAFIAVFGLIGGGAASARFGVGPAGASGPVYEALEQLPGVTLVQADPRELERLLRLGKLDGVVEITGSRVLLRVNTANPTSQISRLWLQSALDRLNARSSGAPARFSLEVGEVAGRQDRYIDFAIPGQIGMAVLSTAIFGTVFGLLFLKKALVLKRLFATPVRGITILLGQGLARLTMAVLQVLVILALAVLVFGFQLANGWVTFFGMLALAALGLLVFMGMGLCIAGLGNDENSVGPIANLITLPQFLLSGVFFSSDVFPGWVRLFADNLPLSYFNSAMRLIATEGAGVVELAFPLVGLVAWGIVAYLFAARTFKWV